MTVTMSEHILPENPPQAMQQCEKTRLRGAAFRASKVFPGAVGKLLERELQEFADFGYRLGNNTLILRVADEIMAARLP